MSAVQFAFNAALQPATPLKVDGIFGPKTFAMTKEFQSRKGLKPDGIIGPLTLDSLFAVRTMTARVRIRKRDPGPQRAPAPTPRLQLTPPSLLRNGGSGGFVFHPPPPAWESPWMTEMRKAHEAFLKWMSQPAPKSPLPPPLVTPLPGPYGQVIWPPPPYRTPVIVPAPPQKSQTSVPVPVSGADYAIQLGAESNFDVGKAKYKESEFKLSIDWGTILGNKTAEASLETAVIVNEHGKFSTEVEIAVELKRWKLFFGNDSLNVKALPYITTAISSEWTANAFAGAKVMARINVVKDRVFIEIGGKFGTKFLLDKGETESGRPFWNFGAVPLAGVGGATLGVMF